MKTLFKRRRFSGGSVAMFAAATLPLTGFVNAQENVVEEVIVTGSRIARDANLTGALPVQSVSADDIRASGEFSLSDVVNDIPALLTSTTAEQSIDSGDGALGANILNLRGLGAERTLVLVDGRRHVGGLQGAASVDIGSIPMPLVERVEVLSGGASAVYGADAVTGVVNFVLRDDFEGLEVDVNYGQSEYGDGQQTSISAVWGMNFADDRGNIAVALDLREDEGLRVSERGDGLDIGSGGNWNNPDLRFQKGDITASATPNFAAYYNVDVAGTLNYGSRIPSAEDFIANYTAAKGVAPNLTAAENALIAQGAAAPARAIAPQRTFPFTSGYGHIIPGNPFTFAGFDSNVAIDLDGNGVPDCQDSFTGYAGNSANVGGCWNVQADGSVRPARDGLIASTFQGFGGDGWSASRQADDWILAPQEAYTLNVTGHYDLTDSVSFFGEAKYVTQEAENQGDPNSFWDLLPGYADNPYLPAFIQPVAQQHGAVAITIDPVTFRNTSTTSRDTYRLVAGLEGELENGWNWETSLNYGKYEQEIARTNSLINDRFFAALDAVTDPNGNPACRSSVDPTAPPVNTPFEIPANEAGYFSFTPGDGSCQPLNIWGGQPGFDSSPGLGWVTTPTWDRIEMDQFVFAASLTGDLGDYFELPGGPVAFATGVEYREEESIATFDNFQLGILPQGSPAGAGTLLSSISANSNLVFRPQLSNANESGQFDATDAFVEFSMPLLSDITGIEDLTLDTAARYSDYNTIGETLTWKVNAVWTIVDGVAVRGGVSEAIRAPNITELFGPQIGSTFRPTDPCDGETIAGLTGELQTNFRNNCIADLQAIGVNPLDANGNYVFLDPLSASFGGFSGGNPNLMEESAETITYGFVWQPSFLDGFSLTADYWQIEIEDAIQSVSSQDIVDGCYRGASLNQNFCGNFTRNTDSNSPQFGGFNFLRTSDINFAKLETSGYDLAASYTFDVGEHSFRLNGNATKVNELDQYTNPADLNDLNPELLEIQRPEWAGSVALSWGWRDLTVGINSQYLGEMLEGGLEIETALDLYAPSVLLEETWIHNLNASYTISDSIDIYGGVRNITQEKPFITRNAFPVSPRGRQIFIGGTYRL